MTERGGGSCRGRRAPHEVGPGSWETRKAPAKRPVFFSCPFGKRTSHFLLPVKLFRTFLFKRPLNVLLTTTRGGGEGGAWHLPCPSQVRSGSGLEASGAIPSALPCPWPPSPHVHPQDLRSLKKHWPEKMGS